MKRYIASDLNRVKSEEIGALKMELAKLAQNKFLSGFLAQELANRRDSVLWDKETSNDEKVGALKQIVGMTGLLCGGGVEMLQKLLVARESHKNKPEVKHRQFKDEVMK